MKILVFGAGVLGSNLAISFSKAHDVTILARNNTYENLKKNGLVIENFFGHKSTYKINIIDKLYKDDIFDVIFVVSRYSQLDNVVPILENNDSKNIVFIGNNINASKYLLKDKNILFGFYSAAGKKYDTYIKSIALNKITIGRTDGNNTSDELINSIFNKTKIKVTIQNKMDDWLKTHALSVLPLVFACYKCDGDLRRIKKDKEYSLEIMDAIIEGYDVLRRLGYEILPKGEYETCVNKKEKCASMYRFMFSNFIGRICISDHAMSARDEFELLDKGFEELKNKADLKTPTYDKLRESFIEQ